jgi:hypothetical protein
MNVAIDDVKVGPADSTCRNLDDHVEARGPRNRSSDEPKRPAKDFELHC